MVRTGHWTLRVPVGEAEHWLKVRVEGTGVEGGACSPLGGAGGRGEASRGAQVGVARPGVSGRRVSAHCDAMTGQGQSVAGGHSSPVSGPGFSSKLNFSRS